MKDDALQAYIQRILALKGQRDPDLTPEELEAIALEVGLTEADLEAGRRAGENHLARGAGYLKHQRWDDAVHELSQALALLPNRVDALIALAEAHRGRHAAEGDQADREAAMRLARRCLAIDPRHDPAFKLLNALDPADEPAGQRLGPWIVGAAFVAVALFGGLAIMNRQPPPPAPVAVAPPEPAAETDPEPPAREDAPPAGRDEADIPVTLVGEKAKDLTIEARLTRANHYDSGSYYKLQAMLRNGGKREITELHAQIELLDAAGAVLKTDGFDMLASHHAPMRPGDRHWFDQLHKTTPALSSVRLTVLTRSDAPAASRYAPGKRLDPAWGVPRPAEASLVFRERAATVSRSSLMKDWVFFKPLFEIENSGETSLRQLKLQLQLFDRQGKLIEAKERLAIYGEGQELRPGETKVLNWIQQVPPSYHHYKLKVLELE